MFTHTYIYIYIYISIYTLVHILYYKCTADRPNPAGKNLIDGAVGNRTTEAVLQDIEDCEGFPDHPFRHVSGGWTRFLG